MAKGCTLILQTCLGFVLCCCRQLTQEDWETYMLPLVTKYPPLSKPSMNLDTFRVAASWVASRAFGVDSYHGELALLWVLVQSQYRVGKKGHAYMIDFERHVSAAEDGTVAVQINLAMHYHYMYVDERQHISACISACQHTSTYMQKRSHIGHEISFFLGGNLLWDRNAQAGKRSSKTSA